MWKHFYNQELSIPPGIIRQHVSRRLFFISLFIPLWGENERSKISRWKIIAIVSLNLIGRNEGQCVCESQSLTVSALEHHHRFTNLFASHSFRSPNFLLLNLEVCLCCCFCHRNFEVRTRYHYASTIWWMLLPLVWLLLIRYLALFLFATHNMFVVFRLPLIRFTSQFKLR